jgi:CubicO group peptidase (beta-lactamase class C family)
LVTPVRKFIPEKRYNTIFGYGYLWNIVDLDNKKHPMYGAFMATGTGGQNITILPSMDLVIVYKNEFPNGKKSDNLDEKNKPPYMPIGAINRRIIEFFNY